MRLVASRSEMNKVDGVPQSLLQQVYFLLQNHCLLLWVLVTYMIKLEFSALLCHAIYASLTCGLRASLTCDLDQYMNMRGHEKKVNYHPLVAAAVAGHAFSAGTLVPLDQPIHGSAQDQDKKT